MIVFLNMLKFIVLVVVTFFSCQLITNKNKRTSYIGILLIFFYRYVIK